MAVINPLPEVGSPLTPPEIRVVAEIAHGRSIAQAAAAAGCSEATVKTHLARIGHRFGANGRSAIVTAAIRHGYLPVATDRPRLELALTDIELDVLCGIAYGLTNSQIAARFGLPSTESVRVVIVELLALFGASTRAQLVALAVQNGHLIVPFPDQGATLTVAPRSSEAPKLTPGEIHVAAGVARGRSNGQIARDLHMSGPVVAAHLRHLGRRLGSADRAAMVYQAYAAGYLTGLPAEVRVPVALSRRQHELLDAFARGRTDSQIGTELHLSPFTVKSHAKRLFVALGATSRAHAVALAIQHGHLPVPQQPQRLPDTALAA